MGDIVRIDKGDEGEFQFNRMLCEFLAGLFIGAAEHGYPAHALARAVGDMEDDPGLDWMVETAAAVAPDGPRRLRDIDDMMPHLGTRRRAWSPWD
ncbi:hypothetical protein E5335_02245 [Coriobacteriaceae bacterium]|nr:hypothetical protein E5335_02245 [Coriobacteriaceae bacterium]